VDIRKLKAAREDSTKFQQELDENSMSEEELINRFNLLERYGLKEMDEKDIEVLLGIYNKDILDNKKLENMERILSKKIYHAIMSIQDIKKAAVDVFIYKLDELHGTVNIIVEYESKGFLGKIMRTSNNNMDAKTVEITKIEISEIFINHPEIIENFEIKVGSF
jgi:hypothetical protein